MKRSSFLLFLFSRRVKSVVKILPKETEYICVCVCLGGEFPIKYKGTLHRNVKICVPPFCRAKLKTSY